MQPLAPVEPAVWIRAGNTGQGGVLWEEEALQGPARFLVVLPACPLTLGPTKPSPLAAGAALQGPWRKVSAVPTGSPCVH
mmetsp:Transcript_17977/g.31941  ORF Transcript_17977/g.31941 Transcript_17977/m.31941 type:complete len:80 (+) Transcript_17977:1678-1917(+)